MPHISDGRRGGEADTMSRLKLVDISFFLLLIMVITAPIATDMSDLAVSASNPGLTGQGTLWRQLVYMAIFGATAFGVGMHRDLRQLQAVPPGLLLVLGYCWLSLSWAIEPDVAVRRLVLTTIVVVTLSLGLVHLGAHRAFAQLRLILGAVCLLNFSAVFALPSIGVHQADSFRAIALVGDWRGIFPEKNYTGMICAITILLFSFSRTGGAYRLSIILLSFIFLWFTNSKTSFGLTVIALAAGYLFSLYSQRDRGVVLIAACLVVLALTAYGMWHWEQIIAPLDRQDTLTGRSQIWRPLLSYIGENWLLGSGYGSFWNIGPNSPIFEYAQPGSWLTALASGHSGYLDLAAQIGIPGIILAVYALILRPFVALLGNPVFRSRSGCLLFALMVFILGHNATETTIMDRDQFLQLMLVIVIVSVHAKSSGLAQPVGER